MGKISKLKIPGKEERRPESGWNKSEKSQGLVSPLVSDKRRKMKLLAKFAELTKFVF